MAVLCKVGIHRWSGTQSHHQFESNVIEYRQHCLRCGKTKRWNKPIR
jgi:hypothetical protein